jgi:hypothetical protein
LESEYLEKPIEYFRKDNILEHWSFKKHQIITNSNDVVLEKYHNWIIKMISMVTRQSKENGRIPSNYQLFLNYVCDYYYTIEPEKISELRTLLKQYRFSQAHQTDSDGESGSMSRIISIVLIVLALLRLIIALNR